MRFDRMYERDGRTHAHTPHDGIGRACIASRGKNIICKCAKSFSLSSTVASPLDHTGQLPSPEPPDWPVIILGLSGGNSPTQKKSEIPPRKFDEIEEPKT